MRTIERERGGRREWPWLYIISLVEEHIIDTDGATFDPWMMYKSQVQDTGRVGTEKEERYVRKGWNIFEDLDTQKLSRDPGKAQLSCFPWRGVSQS